VDRRMSRRRFLGTIGAGAGLVGLAACGSTPAAQPNVVKTIRMSWWGSTERHKRTQDALAAFTAHHPTIKVDTQFSGWDGYWEKLGTQVEGGTAPDVIQMDYSYIIQYAQHGYLRPLDDLLPKTIDLTSFTPDVLAGGKVGGKLYGVNNGINCAAIIGNVSLLKQLGVDPPDERTTWADFAKLTKVIAKKSPGLYGTEDGARNSALLECWLLQRGKTLFSPDNGLGFTPAELVEWMTYWDDLRKAKAAAPAELQATAVGDVQNRLVARRKAAFDFSNSNQLNAYATMLKDQLALYTFPQGPAGSPPGQYLKPSQFFSIGAKSANAHEAGQLISALLTDPEITAILGSERGIPPSTTVRAALKLKAEPVEQQTYDYIDFVGTRAAPLAPPAPDGGAAVTGTILTAATQSISFGKATINQAVAKFFTDATQALKKA
jgi:pectin-derived oligosaccharide transport system substrate-binding protein